MRAVLRSSFVVIASLCGAFACAGGPTNAVGAALRRGDVKDALGAYERSGSDAELLAEIALAVVVHEARNTDAARGARAVAALQRAGERAQPSLQRLANGAGLAQTRVRALSVLAARGDAEARQQLRERLQDADSAIQAIAVQALDARGDAERLRELALAPSAVLRRAAIERLQRAQPALETLLVLAEAARVDPSPPVRVAALRALAAQGTAGVDAIAAHLGDPEQAVRLAAIGELVRADYARGARLLAELLAGEPCAEGIEAARSLLSAAGARAPQSALAHLQRALSAPDNALRGAAAVALMSAPAAGTERLAVARVALEPVRSVRLCLVLAIGSENAQRKPQLIELAAARDVVASQATAELARAGDARAVSRLRAMLGSADATVRGVAVDALASDLGQRRAVRLLLLDPDPGVRLRAASAILAG